MAFPILVSDDSSRVGKAQDYSSKGDLRGPVRKLLDHRPLEDCHNEIHTPLEMTLDRA